jgi:exosortase
LALSRANVFLLTIGTGFLLPAVIPGVGLDYPYFFILVIVLFAWFLIKWDGVKRISSSSSRGEMLTALIGIAAVYSYKALEAAPFGILDLLLIFLCAVVLVYGLKALKLFWVPAAYVVILLAGYQIENYTPNLVALQSWLAGVLASSVRTIGIGAYASGELVTMNTPSGTPILLDVSSDCTGIQGILAFGMLSTMSLLDLKPRVSRLVPIFAVGFLGAFLINIVRLLVVFLTFEYLGVAAGATMHVYFGYIIFIVWVLAFWAIAFRYLGPPRGGLPQGTSMTARGALSGP